MFIQTLIQKFKSIRDILDRVYIEYRERKSVQRYTPRSSGVNIKTQVSRLNVQNIIDMDNIEKHNIVLITLDCLRYSNLSFAGYFRETTPFIDSAPNKFRAFAAAPWTYPSVASIMTGLYPHNHNAYLHGKIKDVGNLNQFRAISRNVLTLPEILLWAGYDVGMVTSIAVAAYSLRNRITSKVYPGTAPAEKVFNYAEKWIKNSQNPFFIYIHLGDLHGPLYPPRKFRDYFGKVKILPKIRTWAYTKPEEQQGKNFEEYKYNRILLYDNTLRYLDYAIEKFYKRLKAIGKAENTVFILTSDHGEEFWEHAKIESKYFYDNRGIYGVGHGHNVFNEVIEVPIVIWGEPIEKISGVTNSISSVDIMPTILDILNIHYFAKLDGISLFQKRDKKRPILSEATGAGYEKKALIIGKYKLLYSPYDNVEWVFDLESDPYEHNPILDEELVKIFKEMLRKIYQKDEAEKISQIIKSRKLFIK
ncbi:sulfatase [Thermococcus paralvinellae]|uniref:Sulfatase N-terminal domain-containing protein n=1 Tax=Thermococcus paralvinellae TaxID=582419 RepID=W0IAD6_9EURY|nr:sulfatase [Thermococcus paralvinellae]AHF81403.1 Hypothetical protein TES1_2028 [Thermococcus paralvinellae]